MRFIYTRVYLSRLGSRLQREQHERDLNCDIEDKIGMRCVFPNLKEEAITIQRKIALFPPRNHAEDVIQDFQKTLKEIYG